MIQNRNAVQAAHEAREAPFRCDHQRVGVAAMLNPAQAGVIWLGVDKVAGAQCPRYDQLSEFLVCAWLGIWQDWCMADMTDGERIAEERIAEAARTGQDWLDLGDLGLKRLPERLTALTNLKRLNLGTYFILTPEGADGRRTRYESNALASIELLSALSNLRELFLDSSGCTNLDPISSLTQLEYLNLKDTRVRDLSPLTTLKQLRKLYCNGTQIRDLSPLIALHQLEHLDCAQTQIYDLSPLSSLPQLVEIHCGGTPVNDLRPLAELTRLRQLALSQTKIRDLKPLKNLSRLQRLVIDETAIDDLSPLATLSQLKSLYCNGTQVTDLTPLGGLLQLETLHIGGTPTGDLRPLRGLKRLKHLNVDGTKIGNLGPIQELNDLQDLSLNNTDVTDLSPIAGWKELQSISFANTKVTNLAPIAGIEQLRMIYCVNTPVTNLLAIGGLRNLTHIFLSMTQVSDLSPLANLDQLEHLDCSLTKIHDLSPLDGLRQLQVLGCNATAVSDLSALSGLLNLRHFDCSATQVRDLTPLIGLPNLESLTFLKCRFEKAPIEIWRKPSLSLLSLAFTNIPGIPDEVLGDNCLQRLRAHLAELEAGAEQISEAKLLILGNGRAGKTQIARRLAGQPFQPQWDSTHGIRITQVTLPAQDSVPETRLKLWDFGGQEIYHGTHALFARTRAIFLLVWSRETELPEAEPDQHGMAFRNQPLRYWHAYAKDAAHKDSPLIIAQTRLDQDGVLPPPLDKEQMASSTCVQVSTADPPRINTLRGALQDAVVALHQSRGAVEIGKPRILLQRRIEKLRQPDGSLPEAWRLMEKSTFADWYQEEGGIASAEYALAYLNDNGTVFYRAGLFQDRIVLDQSWAMAAIYALFDRKETYGRLKRRGGLFERADLAQVWRDYSEAEQRLFLSMMTSCGICFVYRKDESWGEDADNTIYLAPEFLPEKSVIQGQIDATWGEGPATHRQVFTYAFLHEGLIRNVISQLGTLAQTRADYFRGGVCLYDAQTRARALVMQHLPTGEWQGSVSIETKDGDAARLLERLAELVSEENRKLNLSATTDQVMLAREALAPTLQAPTFQAARPPEERPKYAISYAWNEKNFTGPDLEAPVNLLCSAAGASGVEILRDTKNLVPGDSIHAFRQQIARSPYVFVFLSDRYLRSLNCMAELYEIWRECDRNEVRLREKLRIFKFAHLELSDPLIRAGYRNYWATKYEQWHEANKLSSFSGKERDDFRIIEDLHKENLGHLLYLFNDIIRHNSIEEFIKHAFD